MSELVCLQCGREMEHDWEPCPHCGWRVPESWEELEGETKVPLGSEKAFLAKPNKWINLTARVLIAGILAWFLIYFFHLKG